jgi:hypothetical protein
VLIIVLLIVAYLFYLNNKSLKKEVTRQTTNVEVLNSKLETYRITVNTHIKAINGKDSIINLNVGKIQALNYTVNQYKDFEVVNAQTITELKLKLKNVQSTSNITTQTNQNIHTPTIIKDSVMCFDFSDTYLKLSGCVSKKGTDIKYQGSDSIFTVIDMVSKHNFLFLHWGDKVSGLTAVSKNPNENITGLKYTIVKH